MHDVLTVDVLVATDLRFPGGTTASVAEEITAMANAGYRVAVAQVFGPLVAKPRPFAAQIIDRLVGEEAILLHAGDRVAARLAVLRHPAVFNRRPETFPTVEADHVVMVANQVVATTDGVKYYDVHEVDAVVETMLGRRPKWAPIGPVVRHGLAGAGIAVHETDWVNIIDVDEWAVPRDGPRGPVPVIGRHSRPQPAKWPATKEAMLAAYPADGSLDVRILGGAEPAAKILGKVPAAWRVEEFGARRPRDFLADVDFVVYYHDPRWREAFGRTVLEGLASGAVAVIDPALRPTFGTAAIYASPDRVRHTVLRLHAAPSEWREQSARGQAWVRNGHGHEVHVRRVAELIGPPTPATVAELFRARPAQRSRRSIPRNRRTVLFVSSNGAGMGHLTRLLAMARRASSGIQPLFLSVSSAVPVARSEGLPYEYFPSRGAMSVTTSEWNALFDRRLRQAMAVHRPSALVFDGTWPYQGLITARSDWPDTAFVWSRRAMWREGTTSAHLDLAGRFDLVIEPGEFAAQADRGPTVGRADARRVRPIVLLDDDELLPREEAAKTLGLDPTRPAALVTLGAGNINNISSELASITTALLDVPDLQVVTTKPSIAMRSAALSERVRQVSYYPLSRCFRAIDFSFSASGYNSFHEQIAFAVPTAFVPNRRTQTDDQDARARYAGETRTGVYLPRATGQALSDAISLLADPAARHEIAETCRELFPGNGASEAMIAVGELVGVEAGKT